MLVRNLFTAQSIDPNPANVVELVLATGLDFVPDPFFTTPTGLRRAFVSSVKFRCSITPFWDPSPAAEFMAGIRFVWYLYVLDVDEPQPDLLQAAFTNEERVIRGGVGSFAVGATPVGVGGSILAGPAFRLTFDIRTNFWLRQDELLLWGIQNVAAPPAQITNPGQILALSQVSMRSSQ